jgi:DeoR family transcriptional regulator, fructose operon transcriptional repressor
MNFQARKQKILDGIEANGLVEVKALALQLGISDITIRRDLTLLAEQGLLVRTHGGAMRLSLAQIPVSFAQKAALRAEQKDGICRVAAERISEGDVVFLDCGSTVFRMCAFLKNKTIRVITNSLPVANELLGTSVSISLIGGELDPERQAVHGQVATEHIARYRADKAFLGVDGISLAHGLSAHSEQEAGITLAFAQHARERYFLCDSSKLEQDRYLPFAPIRFVEQLITDAQASAVLLAQYAQAGVHIWTAN